MVAGITTKTLYCGREVCLGFRTSGGLDRAAQTPLFSGAHRGDKSPEREVPTSGDHPSGLSLSKHRFHMERRYVGCGTRWQHW